MCVTPVSICALKDGLGRSEAKDLWQGLQPTDPIVISVIGVGVGVCVCVCVCEVLKTPGKATQHHSRNCETECQHVDNTNIASK